MRILLILVLLAVLLYYLSRRFFMNGPSTAVVHAQQPQRLQLVDSTAQLIARTTRNTLITVGIGIVLFLVLLLLGFKIKILWIGLPLSLYLIGQLFVYSNHVKVLKAQRIFFDPDLADVLVNYSDGQHIQFNLLRDVKEVSEIKSVQSNKGTLFGYYKLRLQHHTLYVPYLIEEHRTLINKQFFDCINTNFKISVETKLFPII